MLKHIVMWKLKDFAEEKNKAENAQKIKDNLEALRDVIKEIKSIEVGINENPSDVAWDVVLYSEFANVLDLEIYQKHPEHLKVGQFVSKVNTARAVADYQI